ncbi:MULTISPECIES: methyltransferase [Moorena]|uniref:Methylase involved in ubiquinone/menaquinone biosynthesis n=1 Tax=Moorena producens 3L TaxID=489825 RepID=F4XVX9_9CYAN|nr:MULTISPECIES: methyltransferase [Moorena]EGJ31392.1 methylase involved in ubiquinone/menaquinone biosynthesis [Moorena producens 3L]OLT67013.1 hypothetical protein BI334_20145 [Moorena producens 3L]
MIPIEIKRAMYGFMMSQTLFVGDELGIFDYIAQGKAKTISELAKLADVHPDALKRLVLGAVSIGLLEFKDGEYNIPEDLQPFLAKNSYQYCGDAFSHFREVSVRTFINLKEALKENRPQWQPIFNDTQGESPFTELYNDPKRLENFLDSMWGLGYAPAQELVQKYPFNQHNVLVDVGGGSGSFAIAALESSPNLKAIVFDLPKVRQYLENKATQHRVSERIQFISGDFFKNELPKGDLYVLGYILSDWNQQDGNKILNKIYNSLPKGGLLIILEKLFSDDKNGPLETAMMNIAMLLETFGQHYSGYEYIQWLQKIGFHDCQIIRSYGEKHMVIGIK